MSEQQQKTAIAYAVFQVEGGNAYAVPQTDLTAFLMSSARRAELESTLREQGSPTLPGAEEQIVEIPVDALDRYRITAEQVAQFAEAADADTSGFQYIGVFPSWVAVQNPDTRPHAVRINLIPAHLYVGTSSYYPPLR